MITPCSEINSHQKLSNRSHYMQIFTVNFVKANLSCVYFSYVYICIIYTYIYIYINWNIHTHTHTHTHTFPMNKSYQLENNEIGEGNGNYTPVLLPGKSHGGRSLAGYSPWGCEESDTTEQLHFHFSLSCIGEGNGNPLQCSCLENPRDEGAWWAAVYGVARSWKWLKRLSSSSRQQWKIKRRHLWI